MSSRRFRRSKIYDLNYNIGENYYRSAVDRLDESSRSRPSLSRFSEPPPETAPVEKKTLIQEIDDELLLSRERAHRAIQKPTALDRPAKKLELETDFDEQVSDVAIYFTHPQLHVSTTMLYMCVNISHFQS